MIIKKEKLPLSLIGNSYRGVGVSDVIYDARLEMEYLIRNENKEKS